MYVRSIPADHLMQVPPRYSSLQSILARENGGKYKKHLVNDCSPREQELRSVERCTKYDRMDSSSIT